MYLSVATTHSPATDLGFLMHKNPARLHETVLTFGKALLFYPQASAERCEAALVLDIDPVELVRGKGSGDGLLDQYVNDRPYAASSFLSVAMARVLGTAMAGNSRERPELTTREIPLEAVVTPLALAGVVMPFDLPASWLLGLARWITEWLMVFLTWLSHLEGAVWQQHAPALAALGHLARQREDRPATLRWFEAAVAADPHDVSIRVEFARALRQKGEFARARQIIEKVLDDEPGAAKA